MGLGKRTIAQELAERIRALESSSRQADGRIIPLGTGGLGPLFAGEGLPSATLIELLTASIGSGALTLALHLAKHACGERKTLVVADHQRSFYPLALTRLGIDVSRVIVLRCPNPRDTLAGLVQALRCPAVGAVVGQFDAIAVPEFRRLQLAAETHGGIGLFLRPESARGGTSFAGVRWDVRPLRSVDACRRLHIDILRERGDGIALRQRDRAAIVEIDDATGAVRLFSALGHSATAARNVGG